MKNTTIIVIMVATISMAGCGKKSSSSSATPPTQAEAASSSLPVSQAALTAWQHGDRAEAISNFLAANWSSRPLFAVGSKLNVNEDQFKALSEADRAEMITQLDSLKELAAAVGHAGLDSASKGDVTQARKDFTSVKQFGAALESPDYSLIVQDIGKAFGKMSDTELTKLGK